MNSYSEEILEQDETSIAIHDISSYIENIKDYIAFNVESIASPNNSRISSQVINKSPSGNSTRSSVNSLKMGNNDFSFYANDQHDSINRLSELLENFDIIQNLEMQSIKSRLDNLEFENIKLKKENRNLLKDLNNFNDDLYEIDCRLIETEQYPRRESLVITGIPDHIKQYNLEKTVIDILGRIGIRTSSYEIAACHRLFNNSKSNYPAKTVVRFLNRKMVNFCMLRRDNLIEAKTELKMNLRFYEHLCQANEIIHNECRDLKKYEHIYDFYTRNGYIKIVRNQGDRPIKIRHPNNLYDMFGEYFDHLDIY